MALENIEQMTQSLSNKGGKEVASDPNPNDMSGWYEMYDDLKSAGELPDWMDSFDLFMENLDVLDISPMDFTKRKQPKEGITQLAAYPMGYPGRAEEDMERAYDDYQRNHMLGTPGYESPLFDEDGIIQIDPSTVFGLWMES